MNIVSADWIKLSTQSYYLTYESIGHYAYHWWARQIENKEMFFALGYGGQYICVIPQLRMVIAITSEIYEDSIKPLHLIQELIINND